MIRPFILSLALSILLSSSFLRAEELAVPVDNNDNNNVHVHMNFNDDTKVGECDPAVTAKYMEIMQTLETQHEQQLSEARASCDSQSHLQLAASEESVQEYKDMYDQVLQEKEELMKELDEALLENNNEELTAELERLTSDHEDLDARHADLKRELEDTIKSLAVSEAERADLQQELELVRQELMDSENHYINWRLMHRQYVETKEAVETFYRETLQPTLVTCKEACISAYGHAVAMYQQLRVALAPVIQALVSLCWQLIAHVKIAWGNFTVFLSPHIQSAKASFDQTAGPHIAVAMEKFRHVKSNAEVKLQESPVYPYIVMGSEGLQQLQKYITDGCFHIASVIFTFLKESEAPEVLTNSFQFVKEHPTEVVIYVEAGIATLTIILILNSCLGGPKKGKFDRDGYPIKPKLKLA